MNIFQQAGRSVAIRMANANFTVVDALNDSYPLTFPRLVMFEAAYGHSFRKNNFSHITISLLYLLIAVLGNHVNQKNSLKLMRLFSFILVSCSNADIPCSRICAISLCSLITFIEDIFNTPGQFK